MKIYTTDDGTTVDLEHVLAVGKVHDNYQYIRPWMYVLTLAFNSTRIIGHDTEAKAVACRSKLINAWSGDKEQRR